MHEGSKPHSDGAVRDVVASVASTADGLSVARFIDRQTPGNVGVALSGGGSRSASACMGQLRALHALGLLDDVRAISSVSGGSWLSAAWTFLPPDHADEDFWGPTVQDPGALVLVGEGDVPGAGLGQISERCFAHAITQRSFDVGSFAPGMLELNARGVSRTRSWQTLIAERLYAPLGLYHGDERGRPRSFFCFDQAAADAARRANPGLESLRARVVKPPGPGEARRPFYICNAGMWVIDAQGEPAIAPVQGTPFFVGITPQLDARDAHGQPVGGSVVTPHAFGGQLLERSGSQITVRQESSFALSDIVGISSAFHAEMLLDRDIEDFIVPEYVYFHPSADPPAGRSCHFLDAGDLENLGIASLLSYDDIDAVVAFANVPKPVRASNDGLGLVVVDETLTRLFGYQPYREGVGYRPYDPSAPSIPADAPRDGETLQPAYRYCRVFPEAAFPELLAGLWAATTEGSGESGVGSCAFLQRGLEVLDNAWFGVRPRTVDVLWFCLQPASRWTDQLRPTVRAGLPLGWPHYPTGDTGLSTRAVGYLAHFTSWVVAQHEAELRELFG